MTTLELLNLAAEMSHTAFQRIAEGNYAEAMELENFADKIINEVAAKINRSPYFVNAMVEEIMCEMEV